MDRKSLVVAGVLVAVCALPFVAVPVYQRFFSPEHDICTIITERTEEEGVVVMGCRANYLGTGRWRAVLKVNVMGFIPQIRICDVEETASQWRWECR